MVAKVAMHGYHVTVEEVLVMDVPVKPRGKWADLIADVELRLEKTAYRNALKYTFPQVREAKNARIAVRKYFLKAENPVITVVEVQGETGILYVFRDAK